MVTDSAPVSVCQSCPYDLGAVWGRCKACHVAVSGSALGYLGSHQVSLLHTCTVANTHQS